MCDRHNCDSQVSQVIKQADMLREELSLKALMGQTSDSPSIETLIEQARERRLSIQQTIKDLQDHIDSVRLLTKYMLFDVEATRRENAQLRRELEEGDNTLQFHDRFDRCDCEQCDDTPIDQNHDWDGFGDDEPGDETPA